MVVTRSGVETRNTARGGEVEMSIEDGGSGGAGRQEGMKKEGGK